MTHFLLFLALISPALALDSIHYVGSGRSMSPSYSHGEIVQILPLEYRYIKAGQVAAFRVDELGETVAHRIVRLDTDGWVTRGDGNREDDPWRVTEGMYLGLMVKERGEIDSRNARTMLFSNRDVYVLNIHAGSLMGSRFDSSYIGEYIPPRGGNGPSHSVPDSGATFTLLAIALAGVALVVRAGSR